MATFTGYHTATTGGTYYAFPHNQSLADWTTYRVALTEGTGANIGRYSGTLNNAVAYTFAVFSGASQPSTWASAVATIDIFPDSIDENVGDVLEDTQSTGVLISSGTGSGQLSLSSGVALAHAVRTGGATTYYVSTSGNDSNSGLTPALAKLTVNGAHSAASAGDHIYIFDGTYSGTVTITKRDITVEGESRAGVIITHNSGNTFTATSTKGLVLKNLTVNATAETSSGTGITLQSSENATLYNCEFTGKLDGALLTSSTGLYAERCRFAGTYDGLNATDVHGTFRQCTFYTDTTHSTSVSNDKRAFYMTTATTTAPPRITFVSCIFQALQIVSGSTGKLVCVNVCGEVEFKGVNQFYCVSVDSDFTADMIGIQGGDGESISGHAVLGQAVWTITTTGSNTRYQIDLDQATSRVDLIGTSYDSALCSGNVVNITPTALQVTAAILGADTDDYDDAGTVGAAIEAGGSGGGGAGTVSADVIDASRTWIGNGARATNIVTVGDNFIGTFACKPDLNTATTINSVSSVSITGAATVTATDLTVDRSRTMAHFTVPQLTTTGTYTVVVTVTTVDGQTIPTTCTLKVQ